MRRKGRRTAAGRGCAHGRGALTRRRALRRGQERMMQLVWSKDLLGPDDVLLQCPFVRTRERKRGTTPSVC